MKLQTDSRIFIIDDDPFWTAILSQILADVGYKNILVYTNGNEGLKSMQQNPSLIFLDYQMTGLNGLEVLNEIKGLNENIKVIFCTAHQDLSIAVSALQLGSFDYLLKDNATKKEVISIIDTLNFG